MTANNIFLTQSIYTTRPAIP